MILVAVGSSQFPFDRLLHAVDALPDGEPVVVQHGSSAVRPAGASCMPFIPLHRLTELVRTSRVVVTHAGVGSILLALTNGKRPIVVPRRREFGETVDDHQLECARRFAGADVVTLVEDPRCLADALKSNGVGRPIVRLSSDPVPLVTELRTYIGSIVDAPTGAAP